MCLYVCVCVCVQLQCAHAKCCALQREIVHNFVEKWANWVIIYLFRQSVCKWLRCNGVKKIPLDANNDLNAIKLLIQNKKKNETKFQRCEMIQIALATQVILMQNLLL